MIGLRGPKMRTFAPICARFRVLLACLCVEQGSGFSSACEAAGIARFCFLPLRLLKGLVVVALHKPVEIGRDVEVLRHLVQHD